MVIPRILWPTEKHGDLPVVMNANEIWTEVFGSVIAAGMNDYHDDVM